MVTDEEKGYGVKAALMWMVLPMLASAVLAFVITFLEHR
jgi:hypothetical protein